MSTPTGTPSTSWPRPARRTTAATATPSLDRALGNERKAASTVARLVDFHAALAQAAKDRPVIYLYHPVNYDGEATNVSGVQLFGDGLPRVAFAGFTK